MTDNVTGLPKRGKTYHGGTPTSFDKSVDIEGSSAAFADDDTTSSGPSTRNSGRLTHCILVRNSSGISLEPKRVVKWASGQRGKRVDGYGNATAENVAGVVDDRLPAAGVASNDLFWLMVKGPALVKTALEANANNVISDNGVLVALTAATSQATTSGRVVGQTLTGATQNLANQIQNRIGRAMSAKTTANTNADVLVDLYLL